MKAHYPNEVTEISANLDSEIQAYIKSRIDQFEKRFNCEGNIHFGPTPEDIKNFQRELYDDPHLNALKKMKIDLLARSIPRYVATINMINIPDNVIAPTR